MRALIASSVLLSLSRGAGVVLQALTLLFLVHTLPIEDVGVFGLVYASLGLVRYLGPFGTDVVALRRIAREDGRSSSPEAQAISWASLVVTGIVSLLVSMISVLLFVTTGLGTLSASEIAATALAVPAFALMGAFAGQIRGFGKNLAAQIPEAIGLHVAFAATIALLAGTQMLGRDAALVGLSISAWAIAATYAAIRLRIGASWSLPSKREIVRLSREGLGVFQALGLTALCTRAPLFLASLLLGPASTALIDVASRFGRVPEITTNSISITSSARFANEAASDGRAVLLTLRTSAVLAAVPALFWLMLVAVGGPLAIETLLPPAYSAVYVPMLLITLAVAVNAVFGLASTLLLMSQREEAVRFYSVVQLLVVTGSALLLAPLVGVSGVALSALLGAIVRDGGMMTAVLRKFRTRPAIT
jgi:O-antigen/teichoic acid export membrane protein